MALRRRLAVEALEDRRMLATFTVSNLLDGTVTAAGQLPGSLRQAIFDANSAAGADEIVFSGTVGTINLTFGELQIAQAVEIVGPGREQLTIDAQLVSRIFNVDDGDNANDVDVTISGLTLSNGHVTSPSFDEGGGAIRNRENLFIAESSISGNHVEADNFRAYGGGILNLGHLTVTNSVITQNTVTGYAPIGSSGGGISSSGGNVTIIGSTISGNSALAYMFLGSGSYDQIGTSSGGGIAISGNLVIQDSTISGNQASGGSGGITVFGQLELVNSTVSANRAQTPYSMSAGSDVGGINIGGNTLAEIRYSTITDNTAGIGSVSQLRAASTATVVVSGSIINGVVTVLSSSSTTNPFQSGGHNLVLSGRSFGPGGSQNSLAPFLADTTSLTGISPVLGPLADNGGPTWTHALLVGSPAIDAGNPAADAGVGDVPLYDQRGNTFGRVQYGRIDIGAYEVQGLEEPSLIVTTELDVVDEFDDLTSLREAILYANSLASVDTVTFDVGAFATPQTILMTAGEYTITDGLIIDASGLSSNATINAQQLSRVLHFTASTGDLTLKSLTLQNGRTTLGGFNGSGGGIRFSSSGTLTLESSVLSGNSTTEINARGGGIFTDLGSIMLLESAVSENDTYEYGGGGAGVSTNSGNVTLVNSTISGNEAHNDGGSGGGIRTASGNVTLIDSTVSGNSTGSYSDGGGIATGSGDVTLTNSTVSGNHAGTRFSNGGGISTGSGGDVTLTNSTLSENGVGGTAYGNSYSRGGGIRAGGNVTLTSSTIAGNHALGFGKHPFGDSSAGGISSSSNITITHSIVWGNYTSTSTQSNLFTTLSGTISGDFNLLGSGSTIGGTHNIIGSDPLLGPLADNGGPTWTHALLEGSPAINAGDPSIASPPDFDQRGDGYDRISDGRIDIGAFEVQAAAPSSADFDGDVDVDGRDFLMWQRGYGITVPNAVKSDGDADNDTDVDGDDLEVWQDQYGEEELSAISSQLSAISSQLSAGEEEGIPFVAGPANKSVRGYVGSESDIEMLYSEEVDLAFEDWNASTTLLGKPAVAPFGEMVARRGVAKRVALESVGSALD
jgi:hypothetical protein